MSHVVDVARFLNGEIETVSGFATTFIPGREVDDAAEAAVEFENGSVGTLEATRFANGRRNALQWEINGTKGALAFDMERFADLQVLTENGRTRGFTTVQVSEPEHPFASFWWPPGHVVGWGDTFVHELHHMLDAIANDRGVAPYGATFEDGYRCAEVCDAIAAGGRQVIRYR
jgi:predicted dehydrogenase